MANKVKTSKHHNTNVTLRHLQYSKGTPKQTMRYSFATLPKILWTYPSVKSLFCLAHAGSALAKATTQANTL